MRLMNLQGLFLGPRRLAPRHCERPGCNQATREGKAFCSDHVEEHPYVRELMARLAEREVQDEEVSKRGARAVDVEASITVQEILQHLDFHGARTEERLCRELNLDTRTLHGYVQALRRRRMVTLGTTKRGSTLVKPLRQRPAAAPIVAATPLQPAAIGVGHGGQSMETRRTG